MTSDQQTPLHGAPDAKEAARERARLRRAEAHAIHLAGAALRLRDRFHDNIRIDPGAIVAGYAPIRHEIDPMPLLAALSADGHALCLPVVMEKEGALVFRRWRPGDGLTSGAFGVPTPLPHAPVVRPTLMIVPMLAFDRRGYRLGYGAGFYDRTITSLRSTGALETIGIAYVEQELDPVPTDPHDARLDLILTPEEVIRP